MTRTAGLPSSWLGHGIEDAWSHLINPADPFRFTTQASAVRAFEQVQLLLAGLEPNPFHPINSQP